MLNAGELLTLQSAESLRMLQKALEGLTEESADARTASMMTPRETIVHLTEAYLAANSAANGEEYVWGSYVPTETTLDKLLGALAEARKDALKATTGTEDDKLLKLASEYVVEHDQYHVGQLCAMRITADSSWDPYCIYGEG